MGFFDGLRRNRKEEEAHREAAAQQAHQVEEDIENRESADDGEPIHDEEMIIEKVQVVERDVPQTESDDGNAEGEKSEEVEQADMPNSAQETVEDEEPVHEEEQIPFREIKSYSEKKPLTHVIGETKIIAIINQKGGVGKSTTAIDLSAALGEMNKAVLLVDLDPQGNATSGLGIEKSKLHQCVYDVLLDDVDVRDVIIPDVCEGLDLVPATINLAGAEVELVSEMARENRLKDAIGSLRGKYDYIFVDCPPSLGLLTVNSLVAADKLIIPIQCEFYALEGVTKLLDSMKRVKTRLNPSLDIFGILLTMYDGRTTLSKQVAAEVRNFFGSKVFDTVIPRTVKLSEAPSYGLPITQYDPTGKGSLAYKDLAKEVIKRA